MALVGTRRFVTNGVRFFSSDSDFKSELNSFLLKLKEFDTKTDKKVILTGSNQDLKESLRLAKLSSDQSGYVNKDTSNNTSDNELTQEFEKLQENEAKLLLNKSGMSQEATKQLLEFINFVKENPTANMQDLKDKITFDNLSPELKLTTETFPILDEVHDANKSPKTPLLEHIRSQIRLTGPLSIAEYMKQCLIHPVHGYYILKQAFGRQGDFVTSPEISQTFGDMIGVWCVSVWEKMGKPAKINLVELGPGKGTLMADILRVARRFPAFKEAIEVNLVDVSILNILQQQEALGFFRTASEAPYVDSNVKLFRDPDVKKSDSTTQESGKVYLSGRCGKYEGIPIRWFGDISSLPKCPMIFIAQEFFDAIPVFQFVKTERGWVERFVDVEPDPKGPHHLRFVLSNTLTATGKVLLQEKANERRTEKLDTTKREGTILEDSPERVEIIRNISTRIKDHGGACLVIDYGKNQALGNSLEGIQKHKVTNVLSEPGCVDISSHVDFSALANEAKSVGLNVQGPISQGDFLGELGIVTRVEMLLRQMHLDAKEKAQIGSSVDVGDSYITEELKEKQELLISSVERLIDPAQMGVLFQSLVISDPKIGTLAPFDTYYESLNNKKAKDL